MPLFNNKKKHSQSSSKPSKQVVEEQSHTQVFMPEDDVTVLMKPKWGKETKQKMGMDDPIVGWLVVINGAGKGHFVPLGYGQNSIGRDQSERVSLDFGDEKDLGISRTKHALLSYDYKENKYYLHGGDSVNLIYLNEQPLLAPTELHGGENIVLGETTLRFIAFCGENFTW